MCAKAFNFCSNKLLKKGGENGSFSKWKLGWNWNCIEFWICLFIFLFLVYTKTELAPQMSSIRRFDFSTFCSLMCSNWKIILFVLELIQLFIEKISIDLHGNKFRMCVHQSVCFVCYPKRILNCGLIQYNVNQNEWISSNLEINAKSKINKKYISNYLLVINFVDIFRFCKR